MRVDEIKQREWLRALRRFKYGIKVRAKLGVIRTICEQVATERSSARHWDKPEWDDDRWVSLLYTCIRDNQFPPELLTGFVKTAEVTFLSPLQQPTVKGTLIVVDDICRGHSKALRQKFGVFI